jgi:hypothetical protein
VSQNDLESWHEFYLSRTLHRAGSLSERHEAGFISESNNYRLLIRTQPYSEKGEGSHRSKGSGIKNNSLAC